MISSSSSSPPLPIPPPEALAQIYGEDNLSDGETSDNGLEIVIESPKRKTKSVGILPDEEEMIKTVEKEIDETLDEKAAKSNLTANNVKNILKHVVTNEHVLAMVKRAENPDDSESVAVFEPKLTRAKAKQLFSSQPVVPLPWMTPKTPPEVQVLISDELQEDSSGDEYVPAEEESEDDREGSIISDSDPPSVQPPTPTNCDSSTQTNWSEDGVFKVPHPKTKEEEEEEANIARRTRSKLSLSSTPLEVIEEAFIPPDITTDMYDMDCDDDDWKDFLKKFTRPLDEVTKHAEDEEQDPEYNVLADEEIDKVDKEELRADKAVKVTRKELNELIAELFEFADFYQSNLSQNKTISESEADTSVLESLNDSVKSVEKEPPSQETEKAQETRVDTKEQSNNDKPSPTMITNEQILLLQQQLRQYVQLLTQIFVLTYQHPEFSEHATTCKENLLTFKYLSCDKNSVYNIANLKPSLKVIEDIETKFATNDEEVKETKAFIIEELHKVKESKIAGIPYEPTFPKFIFETISKSDAFMYPSLLPRVPFKPFGTTWNGRNFVHSEDKLIALGMEQFFPYLQKDPNYLTTKKQVSLKTLTHFLAKYLLIGRDPQRLYRHVIDMKMCRYGMNPIKYYFEHKRTPQTLHYVFSLEQQPVRAPREQKIELLPCPWREYLQPSARSNGTPQSVANASFTTTNSPLVPVVVDRAKKPILPKGSFNCSTPITSRPRFIKRPAKPRLTVNHKCKQKLECFFKTPAQQKLASIINSSNLSKFKFNSSIFRRLLKKKFKPMFPSMPTISLPQPRCDNTDQDKDDGVETSNVDPPMENADKTSASMPSISDIVNKSIEKDNPEDINAFMVASSTMKSTSKREPSGAEKKRAKLRKEFTANLMMLSPEDPAVVKEKVNSYVQAYYDKVRETLDIDDYHKFMEVLNNHNEKVDKTPQLYKQVEAILMPKYPDLADEFLTFLTPTDAKAVGKLVPHFMLTKMSLFLRKLEIYFKDQPAQLRKIYQSLTELSNCVNVTMENVKKTILPLLKGNSLLTDWFLQIFPCEKPPEILLNGTWENIKIPHNNNDFKDDGYETVVVPDMEDPFGGPNCACTCHNADDEAFKMRMRHCVSCGTHFYQGRVYLQTGKLLRLAEVTFNEGTKAEHLERLNYKSKSRKKRLEINTKQSPSKEETRMCNESEEDGECKKKQKKCKTPQRNRVKVQDKGAKVEAKKRRASTLEKAKKVEQSAEQPAKKPEKIKQPEKQESKVEEKENKVEEQENKTEIQENGGEQQDNKTEQKPEEMMDWECNAKLSPEHSADSGSEFCEESSQDNMNSESDASNEDSGSLSPHSENSNSNIFDEMSWTRDEDKIILETFQKEPDKDTAFKCIAELLENRTVSQISQRFQTLMKLLQQMVANSND